MTMLKVQKYVPFLHRKPAAQRTILHSKALSAEELGGIFDVFHVNKSNDRRDARAHRSAIDSFKKRVFVGKYS